MLAYRNIPRVKTTMFLLGLHLTSENFWNILKKQEGQIRASTEDPGKSRAQGSMTWLKKQQRRGYWGPGGYC